MKIILTTVTILFFALSCKAQTVDMAENAGMGENGIYYKDINNLLNTYAGTYLYTNGNVSFKVVLKKVEHSSMSNVYFEDLLVGEYEYKVNNAVVVSTLNKLDINYENQDTHSIGGNQILKGGSRACRTCPVTDLFVVCSLSDGNTNNSAEVFIKRITVNGQPAISFFLYWRTRGVKAGLSQNQIIANGDGPASFPGGIDYIMIKQ